MPCPYILLSAQFWNTLSLCSSLNVTDQSSQPYETTHKIILHVVSYYTFSSQCSNPQISVSISSCSLYEVHTDIFKHTVEKYTTAQFKWVFVLERYAHALTSTLLDPLTFQTGSSKPLGNIQKWIKWTSSSEFVPPDSISTMFQN
jgi:hypothetical protein